LDHHGLYVDLDASILFGGATDDPVSASSKQDKQGNVV
jgi:hypothetical protein